MNSVVGFTPLKGVIPSSYIIIHHEMVGGIIVPNSNAKCITLLMEVWASNSMFIVRFCHYVAILLFLTLKWAISDCLKQGG